MLDKEERNAILITLGIVGAGLFYLYRVKCKKLCPNLIDRMVEGRGKYETLTDVFNYHTCRECVEHAQAKFPQILQADPERALENTNALALAMRETGVAEG